ncbi:hypothetical protein PPL_11835 [Heterostelium album PN500]|uniref:Uncharacterized protein n=1 Tax=Heterostelium pallidum (strain ATCC 26659 / Pp 5 / PN500) TaxID=670386 RepID=D3BUL4_HETP5|nr:hypothetical protein PPL_11835 [Heterostelium album PN500]EFA74802.1 hypothetical protein PPL_11835 [Heterostelium album PN500]|eukprot:XP_020426936.1 hypothetical protein PPL_11835 [Heterostelium album PN500]
MNIEINSNETLHHINNENNTVNSNNNSSNNNNNNNNSNTQTTTTTITTTPATTITPTKQQQQQTNKKNTQTTTPTSTATTTTTNTNSNISKLTTPTSTPPSSINGKSNTNSSSLQQQQQQMQLSQANKIILLQQGPPVLSPPAVFGIVEPQLYRTNSLYPINFPFIKLLGLKTVVQLSPEVPIKAVTTFLEENNINLIHLGLKAWKADWYQSDRCTGGLSASTSELELDVDPGGNNTRYVNEQFIELFDVDLVTLPNRLPQWFIDQQKMLEDEEREYQEEEQQQKLECSSLQKISEISPISTTGAPTTGTPTTGMTTRTPTTGAPTTGTPTTGIPTGTTTLPTTGIPITRTPTTGTPTTGTPSTTTTDISVLVTTTTAPSNNSDNRFDGVVATEPNKDQFSVLLLDSSDILSFAAYHDNPNVSLASNN